MQIYGPSGVHGAQSVSAPHNNRRVDGPQSTQSAQPQDELSLSSEATYVDQVRSLPDVRQDRINSIRQAIADGMRPLRLAGASRVAEGLTTLQEVLTATPPLE